MDIKIDERPVGGVTVLDLVGKLTLDQGAPHLRDKINSLISQNPYPHSLESQERALYR